MPSQITNVSNNIDATYPVAGQDNDSQGFRDNFGLIKRALTTASNEITNLIQNTAKTNTSTNFYNNQVQDAVLVGESYLADSYGGSGWGSNNLLASSGTVSISYGTADYFIVELNGDTTYNINGWPDTGRLGKITLEIQPTDPGPYTVQFFSGASPTIHWDSNTDYGGGSGFTSTTVDIQIWDVWTTNSGDDLYIQLKGLWGA
jgi:hypothetical protein